MKKLATITVVCAMALLISACNFPFVEDSDSALATSVAETVEAMESKVIPTLALLPTSTFYPTSTPYPTATVQPVAPTAQPNPCLYAVMTSETIPDGTDFSAGETFTKSWTLKNTGTCTWNEDYKIVFRSGDQMGGPDKQFFDEDVKPGETIKISINLTAPAAADTYKGTWILRTDKGVDFGLSGIWVKIDVE